MAEKRRNPLPWIFMAGGVLLVVAGLTWAFFNKPGTAIATPTPATADQVQRVTLKDAKVALDGKRAVFVDVRDGFSYATSHIPGALSIPLADLPAAMNKLDKKAWYITYCT